MAECVRKLAEFPPDVTDDISDEQLIRNVVNSVYRQTENLTGQKNTPAKTR